MGNDRSVYVSDANDTLYLLQQVGWRSRKTGNLIRPGGNSTKDWAEANCEPVYVMVLHESGGIDD